MRIVSSRATIDNSHLSAPHLEPDDIVHWTEALRERMGARPVVGVLEGGYRLDLLAAGVVAHVRALS